MKVLALDTASPRGSVALADDGEVKGEVRLFTSDGHSRRVLPAVAFLLDSLGLAPREVQAYAVTTGPGSFTGVRVGLSTAQGLALAAGAPCFGVSTLDVLAHRIVGAAPTLVAMIDAYRDQVFAALYDGEARALEGPFAEEPAAFLRRVRGRAAFLGDGAARYAREIRAAVPDAVLPERSTYLAGTLARLAGPRIERGLGVPAAALRPLYLRDADIRKACP